MMNFNNPEKMQKTAQFLAANPLFAAYLMNIASQNALNTTNPNVQNFNPSQTKVQMHDENCNLNLEEHLKYADALVLAGIIDKDTGKSIKEKMAAAFSHKNQTSAQDGAKEYAAQAVQANNDIFNTDFLNTRECLLNYLKGLDIELNKADLEKIEAVVLELEKAALLRNADKSAEKTLAALQNANEVAKDRLMCGSLTSNGSKGTPAKTFTRDEIAKMSTSEFLKNEPVINYQLQNGLL